MAKFLCFGSNIQDPSFFRASLIADIVLLSLVTIFNIIHMAIFFEPVVGIFFAFNLVFLALAIVMLVMFLSHKEVQRFENFQYARSRDGWNIISLLTTAYLIGMTCFRVFGYLNKIELIAVLVFYIIYAVSLAADLLLNREVRRIVSGEFRARDGSSYLEGNNYAQKTNKGSWRELGGSRPRNSPGRLNEENYHITDSVEYINTAAPVAPIQPALKNSNQVDMQFSGQAPTNHIGQSETIAYEDPSELFATEN